VKGFVIMGKSGFGFRGKGKNGWRRDAIAAKRQWIDAPVQQQSPKKQSDQQRKAA
jgi:hypothetical protein